MNELQFKAKNWWRGEWELMSGEQVLAELTMKKWTWSVLEITIGSEKFETGYSGFWGQKLFLRDSFGHTIFEAQPEKWWKSEVEIFLGGRRYVLKDNWWKNKFTAVSDGEIEALTVTLDGWKNTSKVITSLSPTDKNTLLLASIMFYRLKITEANSMAAAAGGGAVIASS